MNADAKTVRLLDKAMKPHVGRLLEQMKPYGPFHSHGRPIKAGDYLSLLTADLLMKLVKYTPDSLVIDSIDYEWLPSSTCKVTYNGEERDLEIAGADHLVGKFTIVVNGYPSHVSIFHRFIGKTFHQYVPRHTSQWT